MPRARCMEGNESTGCPQKSVPPNPKQEVFFTESYCKGMQEYAFGKSDRSMGHTTFEMIKFNQKYS